MKNFFVRITCCVLAVSMFLSAPLVASASAYSVVEKQIIAELMADGLSRSDAEYYAALDAMRRQMEASGETIYLDDSTEELSIQEALQNQGAFRERVLNKDPAALKCALSMSDALNGSKDLERLITTYDEQDKYTIVYEDGSEITYDAKAVAKDKTDLLHTNGTTDETFGSGTLDSGYTNYTGYGEYKLTSGTSYSKNRIDVEFTYASTGTTMTYANGTQSSYGIVTIANSNSGEISREKSTSTKPAEANNQVVYQISGALGGNFVHGNVSISISAGATWTQTVYYRVTKNGSWSAVASTYV